MHLLSMHLTVSGERLGVWTQNWVITGDRDKSILAWNFQWKKRLIVTVLLIVLILLGCFFKAVSRRYVLTWIKGYQHQKW